MKIPRPTPDNMISGLFVNMPPVINPTDIAKLPTSVNHPLVIEFNLWHIWKGCLLRIAIEVVLLCQLLHLRQDFDL